MTQLESVKPKTMIFSKKVRAFRLANDFSQEEMAGLLGITSNYVHLLEAGKKEPSEPLEKLFESLVSSPVYEPIIDPEERGLAIGIGSSIPITTPAFEKAEKVKAAVDDILRHADDEQMSIFAGIIEAMRKAVSPGKKKN